MFTLETTLNSLNRKADRLGIIHQWKAFKTTYN